MPQVDTTAPDGLRVAYAGLLKHLMGRVDASDMPRQVRQSLNDDTGTETYFQHALARSDVEQLDYPGAALFIRARHDDAAQFSKETSRTAEHAHQNVSHGTHRSSSLSHPPGERS